MVSQGWLRASRRAEHPELTSDMRPFHTHDGAEPLRTGKIYPLRVQQRPRSFLARTGDRLRWDDFSIADAPSTLFYGRKVGTDTYHHDRHQL